MQRPTPLKDFTSSIEGVEYHFSMVFYRNMPPQPKRFTALIKPTPAGAVNGHIQIELTNTGDPLRPYKIVPGTQDFNSKFMHVLFVEAQRQMEELIG